MPTLTKPYTKADLRRGMQFRLATPEPKLYCNDDYMYNPSIDEHFDSSTRWVGTGKPGSGELDGSKPIEVVELSGAFEDEITVAATQIGGRLAGRNPCFRLTLDLLSKRFELCE